MAFGKKKTTTPVDETPKTEQIAEDVSAPSSNHAPGTSLAPLDFAQLGAAIAAGISQNAPVRRLTIGEYIRRGGINQYHPDPTSKLKMTREYYQNGRLIMHDTSFDREIELLNQITHSGRYINRLVEVVVIQNGSEEAIDIRFSNKPNFAFELKGLARDFTDILAQIVEAQAREREEMEDDQADRAERRAARASTFGNSKKSRDARAKAGV